MILKTVGTGEIMGKNRSACSLIDNNLLVDCGNGLVKTMAEQGIDINEIETILITHTHGDHILDLPFYIFTRAFKNPEKKTTIYCPKGTEKMIELICNKYIGDIPDIYQEWKKNGKIEFYEFTTLENKKVANEYKVTAYEVEHGRRKPSYGYTVSKKNKTIGFSGDTIYCDNINKIVEKSNVSVLDMTVVRSSINRAHMGTNNIEELCKKYNKTIVATHMSEESRKYAKSRRIKNLIIPSDGEEIIV